MEIKAKSTTIHSEKYLLWFLSAIIILTIVCVISFRGPIDNDYMEYYQFFKESKPINEILFGSESLLRNSDHIYFAIISIFKYFNFNFVSFLFFSTFISICTKYIVLRKYNINVYFSFVALFLWLSLNVFTYEAMQIRYALALGFWFLAFSCKNKFSKIVFSIMGFGIHNSTMVLYVILLCSNFKIEHKKLIRNSIILLVIFLIGQFFNFHMIIKILDMINFGQIDYLSGKLFGYLNRQTTTFSYITFVRIILLYIMYVLSVKYSSSKDIILLNITFLSFVLLFFFSGFNVFFGRLLPVVDFFSIISFFSVFLAKVKQKYISAFFIFIFSIVIFCALFYLALKLGNFKL